MEQESAKPYFAKLESDKSTIRSPLNRTLNKPEPAQTLHVWTSRYLGYAIATVRKAGNMVVAV